MLTLKEYQTRALDALRLYFRACQQFGNAIQPIMKLPGRYSEPAFPIGKSRELPGFPMSACVSPQGGERLCRLSFHQRCG